MTRAATFPWMVDHPGLGPYAERDDPAPSALDAKADALIGGVAAWLGRALGPSRAIVSETDRHAAALKQLDDDALRAGAAALRGALRRDGLALPTVGLAFAYVREASRRHLGLFHHPVQLLGAHILLQGRVAEMATGEGKTITAMLAGATAALAGVPVHVVTVNDYLADRDGAELRPVYEALGLSVGIIQHGMELPDRQAAYRRDVTFCTNKELAFDYLRDRIALKARPTATRALAHRVIAAGIDPPLILRGLAFAIVDEADSILIDEARTPLIISSEAGGGAAHPIFAGALDLVGQLEAGRDFTIETDTRSVRLLDRGREAAERLDGGGDAAWISRRARHELLQQAISAVHLFGRDQHYIVADGKVQIVDEYTGRVMADRTWERGLHQLIEIKEGCQITGERTTLAQVTYQRFFRRYLWLSGMSGTSREVAAELRAVYGLDVVSVPTHRPSRRIGRGIRAFADADARWSAVVAAATRVAAERRPVLIGTRSVAASEHVGRLLDESGIGAVILNARQDKDEAEQVAAAGHPGRITVATNIAGRGTDIRLSEGVSDRGGLHVVLTEFHDSERVDRQLIGRAGRQGDRGSWEALVACDDEILRVFAPSLARFCRRFARSGEVPGWLARLMRRAAQGRAERRHARTRSETFQADRRRDEAMSYLTAKG